MKRALHRNTFSSLLFQEVKKPSREASTASSDAETEDKDSNEAIPMETETAPAKPVKSLFDLLHAECCEIAVYRPSLREFFYSFFFARIFLLNFSTLHRGFLNADLSLLVILCSGREEDRAKNQSPGSYTDRGGAHRRP